MKNKNVISVITVSAILAGVVSPALAQTPPKETVTIQKKGQNIMWIESSVQTEQAAFQEIALPFTSVEVIKSVGRNADPQKADFTKNGAPLPSDSYVFNLENETAGTGTALLRFTFEVKKAGDYDLGIGGDWWHASWLDGKLILNQDDGKKRNNWEKPVCLNNFLVKMPLTAGKHCLVVRFTRGSAGALLTAAVMPQKEADAVQKKVIRERARKRRQVLAPFEKKRAYMEARIQSGIEANRKGNLYLTILDAAGNPVKAAHVKVRQKTHDFKIGANLFMLEEFPTKKQNKEYQKLFAGIFNIATLPFYWPDLEPERGKPRFAKDSPKIYRRPAPDLCLEFCEAHGIEPKAHCLNYAFYTPDWAKGPVAYEKQCLRERFETLAKRYAARIPQWEVTNETLTDRYGRDNNLHYQPDAVEWSFREAERCFPANTLVINEGQNRIWDTLSFQRDRSCYYMQIERALLKGARIDAVGMQFHMFYDRGYELEKTQSYYDPEQIYAVLDTYAKLGRPIHITELTIPAYSNAKEDEEIQAEILKNLCSIWFSHEAMTGIIFWNLVDGTAGGTYGDMHSGENYYYGGLVRFDFTLKPAYILIRDLFQKVWHTELELDLDGTNSTQFRGFYGKYDLEITVNGKTVTREVHLSKELPNHLTVVL